MQDYPHDIHTENVGLTRGAKGGLRRRTRDVLVSLSMTKDESGEKKPMYSLTTDKREAERNAVQGMVKLIGIILKIWDVSA